MIRSVYFRIVHYFISAVVIGLSVAFITINYFHRDSFAEQVQDDLLRIAQDTVETFYQLPEQDLLTYIQNKRSLQGSYVTLYDPAGTPTVFGEYQSQPHIPAESVKMVLSGEVVQQSGEPYNQFIGYPIQAHNQHYGLFIQPSLMEAIQSFRKLLGISLLITLFIGSIFIAISVRFLINPLRTMTCATQQIAKGDFNIQLGWQQQKDELGDLARSINIMAQELKKMELMRQDFVSSVSHEIQSPLTSITGFSKIIRSQDLKDEERNQYLEIIQTESERLSRLSENLLKLSSLESEHHPYHPKSYRVDEQIRRIVAAQEPIWSAKGITLHLALPTVMIRADEDLLSQVWINLLHNAIKFTPDGGSIFLSIEPLIDRMVITIRDTGIGIPEEEQKQIFNRFYKVDRSRKRDKGGSGLGLSIVRKIVDLHSGSIEVHSQSGKGAAFQVTLPK